MVGDGSTTDRNALKEKAILCILDIPEKHNENQWTK